MTISHVIYLEFARLIVSWQWVTEVKVLCYARYKCIVTWMECFHTHFKCCTNFKSLIYGVPNADQPKTVPQNHCKITCIRSDVVLSRSLIITTGITQLEHKIIYLQSQVLVTLPQQH